MKFSDGSIARNPKSYWVRREKESTTNDCDSDDVRCRRGIIASGWWHTQHSSSPAPSLDPHRLQSSQPSTSRAVTTALPLARSSTQTARAALLRSSRSLSIGSTKSNCVANCCASTNATVRRMFVSCCIVAHAFSPLALSLSLSLAVYFLLLFTVHCWSYRRFVVKHADDAAVANVSVWKKKKTKLFFFTISLLIVATIVYINIIYRPMLNLHLHAKKLMKIFPTIL